MVVQGNANAGRSSIGDLDFDPAWDGAAGTIASDSTPEAAHAGETAPADPGRDLPFSMFGDGQSEAEAYLYAYLDRAKGARASGFAPYDELSARLDELTPVSRWSGSAASPAKEDAEQTQESSPEDGGRHLAWFDAKFGELRSLITRREAGKSEIAGINTKLDEIIGRVDRLSAAMPGEKTIAAVETQLGALSRSLDTAREQSATDAGRIARAAKEILAATDRAQEARAGFEMAARHTVKGLGQTVVVAASRAAMVTAEHIASALQLNTERDGLARLEGELRALNIQSRESSERSAAQLERVHETLRAFLEQGRQTSTGAPSPQATRRASLHLPIAAGAPAYTRADSGFGSAPVSEARLDTITDRISPPQDANLLKILEEAEERLAASPRFSSTGPDAGEDVPPPSGPLNAPLFREEERGLPIFGIAIVAIVLLLASAALYYLHTKTNPAPLHVTVLPWAQTLTPGSAGPVPPPREFTAWTVTPGRPRVLASREYPALFTAAEQNPPQPASKADDASEELQMLTSAASRGDREAQFRIGLRFLHDMGLQGDPTKAARWLARAADRGHIEAQFILASLYERGAGVLRDEGQAVALYRKAASAGHVRAMHNLAVMLSARDMPQDYREAARWFMQAASAGLTESQYNLALLYERGLGLEKDYQRAYFWYQVAALAGDKEATQRVERLKQQLPPSETRTVAEQASSWRPTVETIAHSVRG
jgi:localization factor PodJL